MEISKDMTKENFAMNYNIWENEKLRNIYETELSDFFQTYIEQNNAFSRADFQLGRTYNVYFIPTSASYEAWGEYVTVVKVPAEFIEEVINFNINQEPNSNMVKEYVIIHREDETRDIVTFDVKDVFEIEYCN